MLSNQEANITLLKMTYLIFTMTGSRNGSTSCNRKSFGKDVCVFSRRRLKGEFKYLLSFS